MKNVIKSCLAMIISLGVTPAFATIYFSTDFEGPTGISKDGWFWAVDYYSDTACTTYDTTPYAFAAQDNDANISNLVTSSGSQKMNFFSNYGDMQQAVSCIGVNIFQDRRLTAGDVGTYEFVFDSEAPSAAAGTTNVSAFVKLDFVPIAGTPISPFPDGTKTVSVTITAADVGKLLQWGFANTSYNYQDTGVYYDNVCFGPAGDPCAPPPPPPSSPEAIPAVPLWGLLGLVGLIGFLGLRRRA